ncbi:MAG: diacylglycerol/polyprenol kinase family protein [Minicystis sp.]
MASTYEIETLGLSHDLCALLRRVDPSAYREEVEPEARASVSNIQGRLRALVEAADQDTPSAHWPRLREGLQTLLAALERATPASTRAPREAWTAFQKEVQPAYESLAQALRALAVPAPSVRPTNYTRSLFHVLCGLSSLALIRLVPSRGWLIGVSLAFAIAAWTMEISRHNSDAVNERLMRLFGKVAHPHERFQINSSTWYTTALFLLSLFAPLPAAEIAVTVLAFADPAAAFVGRRHGRTRLRAGRSLEGTLAFFAVGTLVSLAVLFAFHASHASHQMAFPAMLALAAAGGVSGALAELYSTRLDDNFTIPVAVAAAVGLVARLVVAGPF